MNRKDPHDDRGFKDADADLWALLGEDDQTFRPSAGFRDRVLAAARRAPGPQWTRVLPWTAAAAALVLATVWIRWSPSGTEPNASPLDQVASDSMTGILSRLDSFDEQDLMALDLISLERVSDEFFGG